MRALINALFLSGLILGTTEARAAFPNQCSFVKLVIPMSPGSSADSTIRVLANQVSKTIGKTVIIENKPSGNGLVAAKSVLNSERDGCTFLLASTSTAAIIPIQQPEVYDPEKDFVPVHGTMQQPLFIAVSESSPFKTLDDLIVAGRAATKALRMGSGTNQPRAVGTLFATRSGFPIVNVPFDHQNEGQMVIQLLQGNLEFVIITIQSVRSYGQGLRLLGIAGDRSPLYPDVQTLKELGVPGWKPLSGWNSVFAAAGTPADAVRTLDDAFGKALSLPEVQGYYRLTGNIPLMLSSEKLGDFRRELYQTWKELVEEIGFPH